MGLLDVYSRRRIEVAGTAFNAVLQMVRSICRQMPALTRSNLVDARSRHLSARGSTVTLLPIRQRVSRRRRFVQARMRVIRTLHGMSQLPISSVMAFQLPPNGQLMFWPQDKIVRIAAGRHDENVDRFDCVRRDAW